MLLPREAFFFSVLPCARMNHMHDQVVCDHMVLIPESYALKNYAIIIGYYTDQIYTEYNFLIKTKLTLNKYILTI